METAVMLSIQPKWVSLIESGEKTIEVRKKKPKLDVPFKCYIYETKGKTEMPWMDEDGHMIFTGRGQVIGEFTCDKMYSYTALFNVGCDLPDEEMLRRSCLTTEEIRKYEKPKQVGNTLHCGVWGWNISNLVIYEHPNGLDEFGLANAPQSYCYVEEKKE